MGFSGINVSRQEYEEFCGRVRYRVAVGRKLLSSPLTLTDKVLLSHSQEVGYQKWERGSATLRLEVDRVALQDATAQMTLLQFMQSQRAQVALPTTIHCDHLIRAEVGVASDLLQAINENEEVYGFLRSAASKYGIGFWRPGSGIIHQVVLENYAVPGGLMIGTDSHTPNAGGIGMLAVGVGGADAAEVMSGLLWEVLHPKTIGVRLAGRLRDWASPKDIITFLCTVLTVKGGTNKVIEYFGDGVQSIGVTGRATICNMGAELGATGSLFPFNDQSVAYLRATNRGQLADVAMNYSEHFVADPEVLEDPRSFYDEVVEIDLDRLEPYVVGPHSPDLGRPIRDLATEAQKKNWPLEIKSCLIGSCTNSSYQDMCRAASIARQALQAGLKVKTPLFITPGSDKVFQTLKRDGVIEVFESVGATVLTNACGPCIGQWKRRDVGPNEVNNIVSSFNRNFPGRNDGSASTLSFLTSPEVVVAMAFSGRLDFNPLTDSIGDRMIFEPPTGDSLPQGGFESGGEGYESPADDPSLVKVAISPSSERLQLLQPFAVWGGNDFIALPILAKTQGKTTTDHISPAGSWLRYRGHLDRISDNMLLGATNAFTGETGKGANPLTGKVGTFASIARNLKASGTSWIIVGDENYGEGSSREHAAMSPRYLGCVAVIARSFARIHETNLKKQGILPLTFINADVYDLFEASDRVSIVGLAALSPGQSVTAIVTKSDSRTREISLAHSSTAEQIEWFRAGSALNVKQ